MPALKSILAYALLLASGAFLVNWLERHFELAVLSTQIYTLALAIVFTLLGIWVGHNLTKPKSRGQFKTNTKAQRTLKISDRELEVLGLVAMGNTNKQVASTLHIAAATVKTHLIHLNQKLEANNRTQAIKKARELGLID